MNPEFTRMAQDAATTARRLAHGIGSANPVAKASAALAAECLEGSVSPHAWQASHEIVRDLGVVQLRESLLHDCATALRLAADAARRLKVHGVPTARSSEFDTNLEQLAAAVLRTTSGLDACETAIANRIAEPRLTEISLERRHAALRLAPTSMHARLAQLSADVERALAESAQLRGAIAALEEQHLEAANAVQRLSKEHERLEGEVERTRRDLKSTETTIAKLEHERHDAEHDRSHAAERLRQVRAQLEALRSDPRDAIREAVAKALRQLPDDAFDRSVGTVHAS
jgi:chromosome segregation ATPase